MLKYDNAKNKYVVNMKGKYFDDNWKQQACHRRFLK